MSGALVYQAISGVAADLANLGLAKSMINTDDGYGYRSIDQLMNRLAPILAVRKLCILPRVLERSSAERRQGDDLLTNVTLKVAYDLVSPEDGSSHTVEVYGEALDRSDKATPKALTAAYKAAMLQTFCVPVAGMEDADASSPRLNGAAATSAAATINDTEPPQGWQQWSADITALIASCESIEALERLQHTHRPLLRRLSRAWPELYTELGQAFAARRSNVGSTEPKPKTSERRSSRTRKARITPSTPRTSKANGPAAPLH
ncbi:hypothetical protein G7077_12710 [Sphingomonas piscis]|uniref:Uncharacterized protein n=1 Tax=Sphingomonas piscis TaxID=2714943 RepID=A0A6G7YQ58_9SPHN|nr:ERF family protein [Sphingomonas piscis]QIK78869.1 hypothetical protein G7077_08145 [Sphingomonas piscis]QIK79639.1 hypothetical protein G7077_12710 [Sphingomonas piscis]